MAARDIYEIWCKNATEDTDLVAELNEMSNDSEKIAECFTHELSFGTAGIRGVIGAGISRMNIYTVRQTTQGLAKYILQLNVADPSVSIAYDSRIKSELFSKEAAKVLAANGIKVYIYPELMPTPMLSFAVRRYGSQAGINVTASHNPSKYNGYKVYGDDGCQMTDNAAMQVSDCIKTVDMFKDIKTISFEEGLANGKIVYIGEDVVEEYLQKVKEQSVTPDICRKADLKVIYSPLNGAGNKPVRAIFKKIGLDNVKIVPEQELPDGNFPTCPYPNPEIRQAFECGLKLAANDEPDLLLATDPDCDRVGIAAKSGDDYRLFTGNEVGAMLLQYILKCRKELGTLPEAPVAVKSIVSTPLATEIGKKYGCNVIDVLTGFKYIGEQIKLLEQTGESDRFVFGFEESYGYLSGAYVRDKDAVVASMLICEMAAYYKLQGKSLIEVLQDIYKEYGYYFNIATSYAFEGLSGMETMKNIMSGLRANSPKEICSSKVVCFADYQTSETTDYRTGCTKAILLPKSNVLSFELENGTMVIVRPSGTEPKVKVYVAAKGTSEAEAEALARKIEKEMAEYMK